MMRATPSHPASIVLPLHYTYSTRIGGLRNLFGYTLVEILPLITVAVSQHGARAIVDTLLLYALWLIVYEVGYHFNDRYDANSPHESDRLGTTKISWLAFLGWRALCALLIVATLIPRLGVASTCESIAINIGLLALLLLHSSRLIRNRFPGRIITFAALAFYKYAPIALPILGPTEGATMLGALFLFYGVARVVSYTEKKSAVNSKEINPRTQQLFQIGFLLLLGPLVIGTTYFQAPLLSRTPAILWLYFMIMNFVLFALFLAKRRSQNHSGWFTRSPRS